MARASATRLANRTILFMSSATAETRRDERSTARAATAAHPPQREPAASHGTVVALPTIVAGLRFSGSIRWIKLPAWCLFRRSHHRERTE